MPVLLPFNATQINHPFLSLRISANHDKVEGFKPSNGEILIKGDCFSIVTSLLVRRFIRLIFYDYIRYYDWLIEINKINKILLFIHSN